MILYPKILRAEFISRPNRFVAQCRLSGETVICHVKNTGRCKELLLPGAVVYLAESDHPSRKTRYDLVCVESRGYLINMDSQAPNPVFAEWAQAGGFLSGITELKREVVYGASRFDFSFVRNGQPGFAEIKGVTLFDDDDRAFFPDAPTERGVKHVHELIAAHKAGYEAVLCFVVQREHVLSVSPNDLTHPAFGDALEEAAAAGVQLMAAVCRVTPQEMTITHTIPVVLDRRRM
jgi:sugar fermentation stimulation protein A